ncbi:uncharacterized protein LOC106461378 [Limulus polyphemus]|uniref:Uncharacterized protein LOC106461378 n=1 Tax=Limulus polyphemus TaxID=6850 RepID=A0ABM1SK78_LIMPO|nr:uncharacterized protein LOC106461378 [Limulus polyphemus]
MENSGLINSVDNININPQNTCATIASVRVPKTNASKLGKLESQIQENKEQIISEELGDKTSIKDNEIINGEIMGGMLSQISSLFSRSDSSTSVVTSDRSTHETSLSSQQSYSSLTPDGNVEYCVPIVGYEVMEERARFTVFKIKVQEQINGASWFVFRRYTDFIRLNKKAVCESLEESVYLLTQKLKDREAEVKLLEEEIRILQSQQEILLKSLKLECSLTMQSVGLCPQMLGPLTSSPKTRNCTSQRTSSLHLVSAHLLRLHHLNMALVNMLEKSQKYWFQEGLSTLNQNDTLTEIAARLSERSSSYLDTRGPFFGSSICPRVVSKSPSFEDIPERYGGDGCTEPEERLPPLGGIENPPILEEGDNVQTVSGRYEDVNTSVICEMFPVVSEKGSLDEPLAESMKMFEQVPCNDSCKVLSVCTHPSDKILTKTDFSSQSEVAEL